MSPTPRHPGTSGGSSACTAAPVSPRPGTRSGATWRTAPRPASAGCSPARRSDPGSPRRFRGDRGRVGRRRGRRRRCRPAQGVVGLPHALRARPAGRAADAAVARPLRHQHREGQRPGMDAAAERDVPAPRPGAVRRAPPGRRSRPGVARLARRAGQPQGTPQREPGPRADGAVHARHRPLHRGRRQGGRPRPHRLDGRRRFLPRGRSQHDDGEKSILGRRGDGRVPTWWRCCWSTRRQPSAWRGGSATRSSAKGTSTQPGSVPWPRACANTISTSAGRSGRSCGRGPSSTGLATSVASSARSSIVVGAARALELFDPPPSTLLLADWAARLGQDLFYPPNVGGWPGGRAWLSTGALIGRTNYAAALAGGRDVGLSGPPDVLALAERLGSGATSTR